MSRDYKKESEKRKEKVKRFVVDVNRNLADKFLLQLEKDNKPYSTWVKENIEKYLKKN
ncbi:unknown [Clostridium sp. CAG:492]|nr:unknown [Clostridium sp. CAG:492]DAR19713.1 MAG TPA: Ribbon-helix-helix domain [Caudoviricetes sp.]DAW44550.1 MAG TPA: Ribbon-helix-helix domain [Caudoviricetes sp.]